MTRLGEVDLYFKAYDDEELEELIRIQQALFVHRAIYATLEECSTLWSNYSNSLYASWLFVPKKLEDIISRIESEIGFVSYEDWTGELK